VVVLDPLEEHQQPQNLGIACADHARLLMFAPLEFRDRRLHPAINVRRQKILRHGFVMYPALQSPVSADEGFQRLAHIEIDRSVRLEGRAGHTLTQKCRQVCVLLDEFVSDLDVLVGNL
jgi:hypothetical protein